MLTLKEKKELALKDYKEARKIYLENATNENWLSFCEAKRICRLLGVII